MDRYEDSEISIPLYAILLDQKNEVLETQYFMFLGSIKKNFENDVFIFIWDSIFAVSGAKID